MKYKRILLIISLLFIVSGCSVKYEIEITKDLKVNEKLILTENNKTFIQNGTTNKLYISTMAETYRNNDRYKYSVRGW